MRIYLVADFAGGSAGEVLFKSEGLSGYTPQGFRAWEGAAEDAEESTGTSSGRLDNGSGVLCVNTPGNSGVGITKNKALALVAQDHGNHPAVLHAAGFSMEHSAKARSIGDEGEISPTLRAGVVPAALSVENHPTDGRVKIREDGKGQTLCSRAGTGGNNVPLVAEHFTPFVKGTRPHSATEGQTWKSGEVANTLNTFDVGKSRCNELVVAEPEIHAFGVCSKHPMQCCRIIRTVVFMKRPQAEHSIKAVETRYFQSRRYLCCSPCVGNLRCTFHLGRHEKCQRSLL